MIKRLHDDDRAGEHGPERMPAGRQAKASKGPIDFQLTPDGLVRLQKLAGNASVSALLAAPTVQRTAPSPEETTPPPGNEQDAQLALAPPPTALGEAVAGALARAAAGAVAGAAAGLAASVAAFAKPEDVAAAQPVLHRGASGAGVTELQTRLNLAGATPQLKVDGDFGPKTHRAVRRYQALSGLKADGVAGKHTWLGLGVYKAPAARANEKEREAALTKVTIATIGHGSSTAAVAAATALQNQQWKNLDLAGLKQLAGLTVELHVIPHNKKLTDLADFVALRGQTTFDGRLWDNVRGINMGKSGTKIRSAVAEEAMISIQGMPSGYGPGFVAGHENGHAVRSALKPDQNTKLQKLFDDRKAAHPPPAQNAADDQYWLPPSWYAGANSDEYWANSVAAYYNHPYNTTDSVVKMYTPGWLAANDPKMYAFLKTVF